MFSRVPPIVNRLEVLSVSGSRARALLMLASISAAATVSGCGSGVRVPLLVVSDAQRAQIATVTNFGDSITCGFYAMPKDGAGYVYSTHGYAGLLAASIGKPARNFCRGGDQAADLARLWVMGNTVPAAHSHQLYTVMIGTNDATACGASSGCLTNWGQTLRATLAWLAVPAEDKILGADIVDRDSAWSIDPDFGIGLTASRTGASLNFPVQQQISGRTLFLAYRVFDPNARSGGAAAVAVDGVPVITLSAAPSTGHPLSTQNGTMDTVFLQGIPLGAAGTHTVTLSLTSANGGSFALLWAGASTGNYASTAGAPHVLIGGLPSTSVSAVNSTVDIYNSQLESMVSSLNAEGMNIAIAPTADALTVSTDIEDVVHPNVDGHIKLAAAFASRL